MLLDSLLFKRNPSEMSSMVRGSVIFLTQVQRLLKGWSFMSATSGLAATADSHHSAGLENSQNPPPHIPPPRKDSSGADSSKPPWLDPLITLLVLEMTEWVESSVQDLLLSGFIVNSFQHRHTLFILFGDTYIYRFTFFVESYQTFSTQLFFSRWWICLHVS